MKDFIKIVDIVEINLVARLKKFFGLQLRFYLYCIG
jgi:hypothetical protein